jgi:hypothetical protein
MKMEMQMPLRTMEAQLWISEAFDYPTAHTKICAMRGIRSAYRS